jgi:D-lactate dehydrogenase
MRIALFSGRAYERPWFERANEAFAHDIRWFVPRLTTDTVPLVDGAEAVSCFVHDELGAAVLLRLARQGTRLLALRCAGFNHIDLLAAQDLDLRVVRVPQYSPHAVSEHTLALILALNRKLHRAYARVREGNLSLDGLEGFELHGQTVGVVGTGAIGALVARTLLLGFGCRVLAFDPQPREDLRQLGVEYVDQKTLFAESMVVTLHCPLTPDTYHMVDAERLATLPRGAMLVNTSRGPLIDTNAVVGALKTGRLGALALDVYEEEGHLFYQDLSNEVIQDDIFARLLTFPNVLITGHQAFFTHNALRRIAEITLANVHAFEAGQPLENEVRADQVIR